MSTTSNVNAVYRRDPERGWRIWHINEIYRGDTGVKYDPLYVPNVEDLVYDGQQAFYRVDAVDPITAIPTLTRINPAAGIDEAGDPNSLISALRIYQPHITERIFIDTLTSPYTLSVDGRYYVYGDEHTHMKLFKGTDTSIDGTVLSQSIDGNGIVVSELVELMPVQLELPAIKRPKRLHTAYDLQDGDLVTAVIYNAHGRPTDERPFIVRRADNISAPSSSNVYVQDIELISSLLSATDSSLIENPLNVPLNTSLMMCRVHYSDGNHMDLEIDGQKVKLHGVENFNTSVLGPATNVVLSYYPSEREQSINLSGHPVSQIPKHYRLANIPMGSDVALKLYVIPRWMGDRYALEWRLTNVQYNLDMDVTQWVTVRQDNGFAFNDRGFGVTQILQVSLDLDLAAPGRYPGHVHAQQVHITLEEPNSVPKDNWVIDYIGDGFTYIGVGVWCSVSHGGARPFKIDIGQNVDYEWLNRLYYPLDPMYDGEVLDRAPLPTHFRLEHGGEHGRQAIGTYSIADWDRTFYLGPNRAWDSQWPMVITWLVESNGDFKTLGVTPLSIESDLNI